MRRILVLAYGVLNYAIFGATFLYLAGFVGNLLVPKSMDSAAVGPFWQALWLNALLVGVFAVQHSVMARPAFKRWWTRFVPAPIERSTYVLCTNLALILLFWQWRPLGGVIWDVHDPIARGMIYATSVFGWLTVLVTTFLINHFDLFGLRQVWLYFRGRPCPHLSFVTPGPYNLIRHPLYIASRRSCMRFAHAMRFLSPRIAIHLMKRMRPRWKRYGIVFRMIPTWEHSSRSHS